MEVINPESNRMRTRKIQTSRKEEVLQDHSNLLIDFVPCCRTACNSRKHSGTRCWWLHPELRPHQRPDLRPNKFSKLCTRSQDNNTIEVVSESKSISTYEQSEIDDFKVTLEKFKVSLICFINYLATNMKSIPNMNTHRKNV